MISVQNVFRKIFAGLLLLSLISFSASAQVRVSKAAADKNPTLLFKGVMGDQQLSIQVSSDLKNCGWFDLVSSGAADYVISGTASGQSLTLSVYNGAGAPLSSVTASSEAAELLSHKAVDGVLNKTFGIDGICCSRIAFVTELKKGIKEIYICDFDGKNIKRATTNNTLSVEPDWMPNGKALVYTVYNPSNTDIAQIDLAGNRSRRLVQYPGLNSCGSVSPSGSAIALILSLENRVDLYVKSIEGRGLRRLTNNISVEASPTWAPNGSQICFVSDASGRPKLYTVSPNGGPVKALASEGSESVEPCWSKDNKIVYSAKIGGSYSLAVLDLSGKPASDARAQTPEGIINTSVGGEWHSPHWCCDNRHVVCSNISGRKGTIYVVDTWTGKARILVSGSMDLSLPCWSGIYY